MLCLALKSQRFPRSLNWMKSNIHINSIKRPIGILFQLFYLLNGLPLRKMCVPKHLWYFYRCQFQPKVSQSSACLKELFNLIHRENNLDRDRKTVSIVSTSLSQLHYWLILFLFNTITSSNAGFCWPSVDSYASLKYTLSVSLPLSISDNAVVLSELR